MSENVNVAERTPDAPVVLDEVGATVLEEARATDRGHAAITLTPGPGGPLKQTIVAVEAGGSFGPQRWNGPATLQVLAGSGEVSGTDARLETGTWVILPAEDTVVTADEDLVALLTVALVESGVEG